VSSIIVDGLVLPLAVGGHPALDFCNTRAGWNAPDPKEYLRSYQHLVVWAREAGLLQPAGAERLIRNSADAPAVANGVLDSALELREAAYRMALGPHSADDFDLVGTQARAARTAMTLRATHARPGPIAVWALAGERIDTPLLAVAAQLDDLLCSPLSGVVAACPGRGCGWLFADPRRRRRWCDMAVCGNRAKARRHAERLAAPSR